MFSDFYFFKQKTAYEMRISDWSSDVCSSDLLAPWNRHTVRGNHEEMLAAARADRLELPAISRRYGSGLQLALEQLTADQLDELCSLPHPQIGRASCRERVCQYV